VYNRLLIAVLFLLIIIVTFPSCKSKKTLTSSEIITINEREFLQILDQSKLDFVTLEAKGSAQIKSENFGMGGSFLMRLEKDKRAWAVIKKFGIEVARMYMVNDTVTVLNRFEKSFYKISGEELGKKAQLELNQKDLIQIMAGNVIFDNQYIREYSQDSTVCEVSGSYEDYMIRHRYDMIDQAIIESKYSDQTLRQVIINYSNFQLIKENFFFATQREYSTNLPKFGPSNITVKISNLKLDEEISFPFEVPSHYQEVYY